MQVCACEPSRQGRGSGGRASSAAAIAPQDLVLHARHALLSSLVRQAQRLLPWWAVASSATAGCALLQVRVPAWEGLWAGAGRARLWCRGCGAEVVVGGVSLLHLCPTSAPRLPHLCPMSTPPPPISAIQPHSCIQILLQEVLRRRPKPPGVLGSLGVATAAAVLRPLTQFLQDLAEQAVVLLW